MSRVNGSIQKLGLLALLMVVAVACAHAPVQRDRPPTEDYIARSIAYAIRVSEPAAEYEIAVPPTVSLSRVLKQAAAYSRLELVAGSRVLRTPLQAGQEPKQVRIVILSVEWPMPRRALVRFTLDGPAHLSCLVGIWPDSAEARAWLFEPMGEEYCWPRPSKVPSS